MDSSASRFETGENLSLFVLISSSVSLEYVVLCIISLIQFKTESSFKQKVSIGADQKKIRSLKEYITKTRYEFLLMKNILRKQQTNKSYVMARVQNTETNCQTQKRQN